MLGGFGSWTIDRRHGPAQQFTFFRFRLSRSKQSFAVGREADCGYLGLAGKQVEPRLAVLDIDEVHAAGIGIESFARDDKTPVGTERQTCPKGSGVRQQPTIHARFGVPQS